MDNKLQPTFSKVILFLQTPVGLGIIGVALLLIGFVSGMEYKAYQIRSAFSEVATQTSQALKGMFGKFGEGQSPSSDVSPSPSAQPNKVTLAVLSKGFDSADFSSSITLKIQLTNITDKDIKGVQGTLVFKNIFGDEITSSDISYDKGIPKNGTITWEIGRHYNQFMDSDTKLKNADLSDLKYDWQVKTIVYQDGTQETF